MNTTSPSKQHLPHDANVPPHFRVAVLEAVKVLITQHKRSAWFCATNAGASLILGRIIPRATWHEIGTHTCYELVVELVRKHSVVSVGERIDPVQPDIR